MIPSQASFAPGAAGRPSPCPLAVPGPGLAPVAPPAACVSPQRAYLELEALADAVPQARHLVRGTLARWGLSQVADDAELIACELLTNAISASAALPFPACVGLLIAAYPGRLIVLVWDASQERPVRPEPDDDAVAGRGLGIIEALSACWGWVPDARGKVVWALIGTVPTASRSGHNATAGA